ncbi:hypothetical protein E8E14_011074 [Neopestalotiopsis sp. 37M]|nr:hypothetical protein E8E14_011074 [Neopestalotiopsis sp. 37M]
MMASSFPQFGLLPLELQREIWQAALQVEAAGLCITFGGLPNHRPRPADVDLHCLMHVSRESRAMAMKHFQYDLRRDGGDYSSSVGGGGGSDDGALIGASRAFRPDLDVLYIPTDRYDGFFDWRFLDSWPESLQPHHLALDGHEAQLSRGGVGAQVAALVASGRLPDLKSVSLIFAAEPAPVPVYSSKRAYKLDDLGQDDYVWCALPGGCKYEATDPFLIADWWKASILEAAGDRDLRHLQVIPRRINPRRYADPPSKGWLASTFGIPARLRQILP